MVDKGYWTECFPATQNDNMSPDLYCATIDELPEAKCTGKSVDQAVQNLRTKLSRIQKMYHENGKNLPRSHSIYAPVRNHCGSSEWLSVYLRLEDTSLDA